MNKAINILLIIFTFALAVTSLRISHTQSYDSLIDEMISQSKDANGTPSIDRSTIISLSDGSNLISANYANSLQITASEGSRIAQVMKSGDFSSFQAKGVTI